MIKDGMMHSITTTIFYIVMCNASCIVLCRQSIMQYCIFFANVHSVFPKVVILRLILVFREKCTEEPHYNTPEKHIKEKYSNYTDPGECKCTSGRQECPEGAAGPPPNWFITPTNNRLLNLTGSQLGVNEYLVRSHAEYILQR